MGNLSAPVAMPRDEAALRRFSEDWGRRYDANRDDKNTALTYAKSLHALGQNTQAVAVLQGLAIQNPEDMQVLAAYGKALADAGQLKQAGDILTRAHTPERPDWSVLSTQGSIADQMGDHDAARGYYETALKIRPNDPTVPPISGSPTRCRSSCRKPKKPCASPPASPAPTSGCGKIWRWCWACKANSPRRKNFCAGISRRRTPAPISPRSAK